MTGCNTSGMRFHNVKEGTQQRFHKHKNEHDFCDQDLCLSETLRKNRNIICFPIIKRGLLWYNNLTEDQVSELNSWYQAWLDVTDTLEIPEAPIWLE